jgi:hypothetical protein
MKIKYVGKRDSFKDNLYGSRIFFPRDEFIEVPDVVAKKLLRHPEFSKFTGAPVEQAPDAPNILEMTKAEFGEYAKSLGIDLDMRRSLENLRKDFLTAMEGAGGESGNETPENQPT